MSEQGLPASVPERRTSPRDHAVTHVMAWCRNNRLPAMLVKADGSVVWCNEAGAALLAEREHFHLRSEKLTCIDSGQDPALRAFVGKDGNDLTTWIVQGDSSMLIVLREDIPGKDLRGLTFHSAEASVGYLWADWMERAPRPFRAIWGSGSRPCAPISGGSTTSLALGVAKNSSPGSAPSACAEA